MFLKIDNNKFPDRSFHSKPYDPVDTYGPVYSDIDSHITELRRRLRQLGEKLGWGDRASPTVDYMARSIHSDDEYEFFYHAACSSVHASLHHMLRMVWRKRPSGTFSITNANFRQYYQRFALAYSTWLCALV